MLNHAKGVRSLRTMSGKVDKRAVPYRAYMQITCLEMEKARRNSERQSASRLITEIDVRLRDIEAEKERILETLSETGSGNGTRALPAVTVKSRRAAEKGGFKIRY